jgi:hypothetical protein
VRDQVIRDFILVHDLINLTRSKLINCLNQTFWGLNRLIDLLNDFVLDKVSGFLQVNFLQKLF